MSAYFNCYACGLDELTLDMRRASVSRRAEHLASPSVRSRSVERWKDEKKETIEDQEIDGSMFHEKSHKKTPKPRHVRAMSDPFDTQEDVIVGKPASGSSLIFDASADLDADSHLPTMPRYPVAETRNKNCYSEPPVDIYQVRGPHYFADNKKITSGPFMLQSRGCDLFLTEKDCPVELEEKTRHLLGGALRRHPTLLINFRFPWGHMAMYWEVSKQFVPYMMKQKHDIDPNFSPPERAFALWLLGDTRYKNERLKLIPYVAEGPWVVRNMVTGRPAIIGKKLPVSYSLDRGKKGSLAPLLCASLDIGNSSATAKRIVSVCRRYMSSLTVDIGFVIQGEADAELPEQMLAGVRIHGPDPLKAFTLRK